MSKLSLNIAALALTVFTASLAFAEQGYSTLAKVTRNGESQTRVIYKFWSTEYPSPVIDLNSKDKKGTTTVVAHKFVQDLSNPMNCTIKNGLYHPWSLSARSAKGYVTVTGHDLYRVNKANSTLNSELSVPEGAVIAEVIYLSEGFCSGVMFNNEEGQSTTTVRHLEDFDCAAILDQENFTQINDKEKTAGAEQYIQVKCADGQMAYVRDQDMLKAPGAKEGEITGYGSVGPAPKN